MSHGTIHTILHEDLGLVKKSARWVPELLTDAQKEERVRTCKQFTAAVRRDSMHRLTKIVTMDETMVSFHTPETKKQSKRWIKKGKPGPLKARVHASRQKQMVLVFFDAKGVIYTNIVPRGQTVNAAYITKALAVFMKKMESGFFTGTMLQSIQLRRCRTGWPPGTSRSFHTHPIRRISPQLTSSSSLR